MKKEKQQSEFWLFKLWNQFTSSQSHTYSNTPSSGNKRTFIFSEIGERRFFQYLMLLVGGFYVSLYFSSALFLINPQLFYFRPWEYFDDIVYHSPGKKLVWNRPTKGDSSRLYLFKNQDKWHNYVSCDEDGFRSVPLKADKYPILVIGDCQSWGTGLSDSDTLPWRLAEELNIPVYNGARVPFILKNLLGHPKFSETKLIIELLTGHLLNQDLFPEKFAIEEYKPLVQQYKNSIETAAPKRYFLPYKLARYLSTSITNLMKDHILYSPNASLSGNFKENKTPENLNIVLQNINKRAKELEALGYEYFFIPLTQFYYVNCSDQELEELGPIANWQKDLIDRLDRLGVYTLCLDDLLRANKDKGLFFKTDSHFNSKAIDAMVPEIVNYIKDKKLIDLHT